MTHLILRVNLFRYAIVMIVGSKRLIMASTADYQQQCGTWFGCQGNGLEKERTSWQSWKRSMPMHPGDGELQVFHRSTAPVASAQQRAVAVGDMQDATKRRRLVWKASASWSCLPGPQVVMDVLQHFLGYPVAGYCLMVLAAASVGHMDQDGRINGHWWNPVVVADDQWSVYNHLKVGDRTNEKRGHSCEGISSKRQVLRYASEMFRAIDLRDGSGELFLGPKTWNDATLFSRCIHTQ